jgi:hypothetical protein
MWITPQISDVEVSANEIAIVDTQAGAANLSAILVKAVNRIRSRIPKVTPIGADGTIPDELLECCVAIAAYRYLSQIPTGRLITTARKNNYEQAEKDLVAVAEGQLFFVPATELAPVQPDAPSPSISGQRERRNRREHSGY